MHFMKVCPKNTDTLITLHSKLSPPVTTITFCISCSNQPRDGMFQAMRATNIERLPFITLQGFFICYLVLIMDTLVCLHDMLLCTTPM